MTDLAPGDARTRGCPRCGAQNDATDVVCEHCGEPLVADEGGRGRDAERGDLDVIEVERAAGAAGFDAVFGTDGEALICPSCSNRFTLDEVPAADAMEATDSAHGDDDSAVVTCRCPSCGTAGHAVVGDRPDDPAGVPQNDGTQ